MLSERGAEVISIPVTESSPPAAGLVHLEEAIRHASVGDIIAVTSAAASRVLAAFSMPTSGVSVAAVGPATADVLERNGWSVNIVPKRHTAADLAVELGSPSGTGRVMYVAAAAPRPEFAMALQASGWIVDHVVAYETKAVIPDPAVVDLAIAADAVIFTAGSSVRSWLQLVTSAETPPVVTIGPATSETARAEGLTVAVEAAVQSIEGLVEAVVAIVGGPSSGVRTLGFSPRIE